MTHIDSSRRGFLRAAKPTAEFDAAWGAGMLPPAAFIGLVYATL